MNEFLVKLFKLIILGLGVGFNDGTQSGGKDSGGGGVFLRNGIEELHFFAGTDNASGPSGIFKTHWVSYDTGKTVVQLADAPWAKRNEQGFASCRNRIYMWGGANEGGQAVPLTDSWYYDATGWHQLATIMTIDGLPWNRSYFSFCYNATTDSFYTGSGINGTSIISSKDCISWFTYKALPSQLQGVTGSTMTWFKNELYYASGSGSCGNPYMWKFSLLTNSWKKNLQTDWLVDTWGNINATDSAMFYVRGTTVDTACSNHVGYGNKSGCYYSTDGYLWHRLRYEYYATHATTVYPTLDRKSLIISQGNNFKTAIFQFKKGL